MKTLLRKIDDSNYRVPVTFTALWVITCGLLLATGWDPTPLVAMCLGTSSAMFLAAAGYSRYSELNREISQLKATVQQQARDIDAVRPLF